MGWIEDVMEASKEAESPRSYIYWAALSAISAVVKKNVWINRGGVYKLYPNIYVLLVGKSGLRKSYPALLAKKLVAIANNTRIISGQNSIQGIIDELSKTKSLPQGGMMTGASCFLQSGEFSNLIMEDNQSMTILTELYGTHEHEPEWTKLLKSGLARLKEPCITLLGATNLDLFHDRILDKDIKGGFLARTMVILETQKGRVNSLTEDLPEIPYEDLAKYLQEISKISGPFKWSKGAKRLFDEWFIEFNKKEIDDQTGIAMRIHDHIIKIAMLITLSRRPELILEKEEIEDAMTACMNLIQNVSRITEGKGKSDYGSRMKMILEELTDAPDFKIEKVKLLQKHYGEFDVHDLHRIMDTMQEAGYVNVYGTGLATVYELKPKWVEQWREIKRRQEH